MSAPDGAGESVAKSGRPWSRSARKRFNPPMPPEQSRRQSDVVQSAWSHFRGAAPVIAFLNTRHDALDALPLHLAIESDEGLERVKVLLSKIELKA